MDELTGAALLRKLLGESATKANNVLFLHPQLALCGLVHTVDEAARAVGYSHVPSMKNVLLLAARALLRTGRGQTVVFTGEWAPTLFQALLACVGDALADGGGPLRWRDAVQSPAVLQAVTHLLLLLGTVAGAHSMMGLVLRFHPRLDAGAEGAVPVRVAAAPLWLHPDFLTRLRDAGRIDSVLATPMLQHALAAPRPLLKAYLPTEWLDEAGAVEDVERWRELVALVAAAGFRGDEALQLALEGVLHALAVLLLLLTTPFPGALLADADAPYPPVRVFALAGLLNTDVSNLCRHLHPHVDPATSHVVAGLAESIYFDLVEWAAALADAPTAPTPYRLPTWPFTPETITHSRGSACGVWPEARPEGLGVVVMPQGTPSFDACPGGVGAPPPLPDAAALGALLANVAAEHLNVWAGKTLLPPETPGLAGCVLVEHLMSPTGRYATMLEGLLDGGVEPPEGRRSPSPLWVEKGCLVVHHTHAVVRYPLSGLRVGEGRARVLCDDFLSRLAGCLEAAMHGDPMFVLHVPLYLTSAAGGGPALYPPLAQGSADKIDASVFLAAARQLFKVTSTQRRRGDERATERVSREGAPSPAAPRAKHPVQAKAPPGWAGMEGVPEASPPPAAPPAPVRAATPPLTGRGRVGYGSASNPLAGSMAEMVPLTKAFRLRKRLHCDPPAPEEKAKAKPQAKTKVKVPPPPRAARTTHPAAPPARPPTQPPRAAAPQAPLRSSSRGGPRPPVNSADRPAAGNPHTPAKAPQPLRNPQQTEMMWRQMLSGP